MFILSHFVTSDIKPIEAHIRQNDVPDSWGGVYSIYKPNTPYNKSNFWVKRWSKKENKTTKSAFLFMTVKEAHSESFLNFMK